MTEALEQQPESIISTGKKVWQVLGILVGTATCISLVKNGFTIELNGLPGRILQQYTWLRDMLFEPVVWALRHFGLVLPWWLKDIVVVYGIIAGAFWRSYTLPSDQHGVLAEPKSLREMGFFFFLSEDMPTKFEYAVFWPLWIIWLRDKLHYADYTRAHLKKLHPKNRRGRSKAHSDLFVEEQVEVMARRQRNSIIRNIIIIACLTLAFFLWNFLQNVSGPG